MAVYTVYADILWLVNFVLDFALLWGAALSGGFVYRRWRLAVSAAMGAFYGVGLIYPALAPLYIMPLPLLFPLLMLAVGFGRMGLCRFARLTLCFYVLSFIMGGAALAVRFMLGAGLAEGISFAWLTPALLAAGLLAVLSVGYMRRTLRQSGLNITVELWLGDKSCRTLCFLDSGNTLREPMSGRAVMPLELSALSEVLPWDFYDALDKGLRRQAAGGEFRPYRLLLKMQGRSLAERLLLVPYSGVEGGGMLGLAFVPDKVCYHLGDGRQITPSVPPVVLPVVTKLRGLDGARGLLNPQAVFAADEMMSGTMSGAMNLEYGCDEGRRIGA